MAENLLTKKHLDLQNLMKQFGQDDHEEVRSILEEMSGRRHVFQLTLIAMETIDLNKSREEFLDQVPEAWQSRSSGLSRAKE